MDVKKYNRIKLFTGILSSAIFFLIILIIFLSGFGNTLDNWLNKFIALDYLRFIVFVYTIVFFTSLFTTPLDFYSNYILEHKYNLSNQTFKSYIVDRLKSLSISILIVTPTLLIFYYLLKNYPDTWWLFFSITMFFISVILAQLFPILIFPLFFKLKPIENEELISVIKNLAEKNNFKFSKVFSFDLSSKTKKANAALTGIGKTKKIILGDNLLNLLSIDEIKTVLAHEIGHYKLKHIPKNLIYSTVQSFLIFFVLSELYKISIYYFGYKSLAEIGAFPLIILLGFLIGLIITPLSNYLSRRYEYEADSFAVKVTNLPEAFKSSLNKLFEKNLSDKEPHRFVEWYFYSHPSLKKRLNQIDKFSTINNNLKEQLN